MVGNAFRSTTATAAATTTICLRLRFDCDLGLYRVRDEALLMRAVIHLLDFLRRRLFFAGEFQTLAKDYACDGESSFGIFLHVADRVIIVFVEYEPFFTSDGEKRQHVATRE